MKNADKPISPLRGSTGSLFSGDARDFNHLPPDQLIGLTKREYFAGQALVALSTYCKLDITSNGAEVTNKKMVAFFCVELADELLKALESENT